MKANPIVILAAGHSCRFRLRAKWKLAPVEVRRLRVQGGVDGEGLDFRVGEMIPIFQILTSKVKNLCVFTYMFIYLDVTKNELVEL